MTYTEPLSQPFGQDKIDAGSLLTRYNYHLVDPDIASPQLLPKASEPGRLR